MFSLKTIGGACQRVRRKVFLTQKEVAEKTNYSVSTISAYENGRLNNASLLAYYIEIGLTREDLVQYDK